MILCNKNKQHHGQSSRWRCPQNILMGVMLLVIIVMGSIIIPYRGWLSAQILGTANKVLETPKKKFTSQTIKYLPASMRAEVDKVYLHVDYKAFQKLAYMRKKALDANEQDWLFKKEFDYVDAEVEQGKDILGAKIRLKGDRKIHYSHANEWSFRVKMKGDKTLYGVKYFSLQKPLTKNYIYEWLFHKALEREDVLSLKYKFVNLYMNGEDLGIYALEEHFGKRLVERQKRREGPIIRFIEDFTFAEDLSKTPIGAFRAKQDMAETSRQQLQSAIDLLDAFRQNDLSADEVFDIEKLAMFFALSDLLATAHGTVAKSVRFYYNPINAKLEPIGFDGHYAKQDRPFIVAEAAVDPRCQWFYLGHGRWFELIFNNKLNFNKKFFEAYIAALRKVSSPKYLSSMLSELRPEIENNLAILHKDFPLQADHFFHSGPDLFVFDTDDFFARQEYIRSILGEKPEIQAFIQKSSGEFTIAFGNTFRLPVEIVSVTAGDVDLTPLREDRVLPGELVSASPKDVPSFRELSFALPRSMSKGSLKPLEDITITYRMVGSEKSYQTSPQPFPYNYTKGKGTAIMRSAGTHMNFPFVKVDEPAKKIVITKGQHHIHSDLIFPEGYTIVAGSGVSLDLHDSAMILSKSPIQFFGSEDSPIVIESSDGTGQGFTLILQSSNQQVSTIDHVVFKNLRSPQKEEWGVSGAVTIYEAKVDISNAIFANNQSEDCLNLVRSEFRLSNTTFSQTFSDALDLDFSEGTITNSRFSKSGNDAIDLSGSIVTIKDVIIDGVGDKAISVGEKSAATASNIRIDGAEIALTCKDQSTLTIDDCTISNSRIGVTAYQKKPEFGSGVITATNLTQMGSEVPYMIEKSSTMTLDGKTIPSKFKKVKDLLYGAQYGKSSK